MDAARTCSRLLTPSIQLLSGHGHVSQTAVQVVADVLSKLLVVGITDPGIREWILLFFLQNTLELLEDLDWCLLSALPCRPRYPLLCAGVLG